MQRSSYWVRWTGVAVVVAVAAVVAVVAFCNKLKVLNTEYSKLV
jgi:ribonuclease HIII